MVRGNRDRDITMTYNGDKLEVVLLISNNWNPSMDNSIMGGVKFLDG